MKCPLCEDGGACEVHDQPTDLNEFRLKRAAKPGDLNVASCMNCGDEYPWGRRLEHDCARDRSKANHPSTKS